MFLSFHCGPDGKEFACNVGDLGLIPGLPRSPGDGKGSPLQYSGLENSMDCILHGVTKSRTWLSNFHFQKERGLSWWLSVRESTCQCRRHRFDPWLRNIPWKRKWQPLQYSCLENSRGAWWATLHGIAKREMQIKTTTRYHLTPVRMSEWVKVAINFLGLLRPNSIRFLLFCLMESWHELW